MSQSTPMPTTIVSTVFLRPHATRPATTAATSLALPAVRSSAPGARNTTAGTAIAVIIATGTWRNARVSRGGMSLRANHAINDTRDTKLRMPTTSVTIQIVSVLSTARQPLVGNDATGDREQSGANQREAHRQCIERDHRDGRDNEHDDCDPIEQQRREYRDEAQRHDEFELPR